MKAFTDNGRHGQPAKRWMVKLISWTLDKRHRNRERSAGGTLVLVILGLVYICMVGWLDLSAPRDLDLKKLKLNTSSELLQLAIRWNKNL